MYDAGNRTSTGRLADVEPLLLDLFLGVEPPVPPRAVPEIPVGDLVPKELAILPCPEATGEPQAGTKRPHLFEDRAHPSRVTSEPAVFLGTEEWDGLPLLPSPGSFPGVVSEGRHHELAVGVGNPLVVSPATELDTPEVVNLLVTTVHGTSSFLGGADRTVHDSPFKEPTGRCRA